MKTLVIFFEFCLATILITYFLLLMMKFKGPHTRIYKSCLVNKFKLCLKIPSLLIIYFEIKNFSRSEFYEGGKSVCIEKCLEVVYQKTFFPFSSSFSTLEGTSLCKLYGNTYLLLPGLRRKSTQFFSFFHQKKTLSLRTFATREVKKFIVRQFSFFT